MIQNIKHDFDNSHMRGRNYILKLIILVIKLTFVDTILMIKYEYIT